MKFGTQFIFRIIFTIILIGGIFFETGLFTVGFVVIATIGNEAIAWWIKKTNARIESLESESMFRKGIKNGGENI